MSAAPMVRRCPSTGATRPILQVVPGPARRPRKVVRRRRRRLPTPPFVVLALLVLGAGLSSLLAVNTVTSQESFRLEQLQQRSQTLAHEEQALHLALLGEQSPTRLAEKALRLGLQPADAPRYITVP